MDKTDEMPSYTIGSKADWSLIPSHMHSAVRQYIEDGIEPGSFLTAVICNDLREAAGRADHINQRHLFEWAQFFWLYAPAPCWGSEERYRAWVKSGGINGQRKAPDEAV